MFEKTILLAEDDPAHAELIRRAIGQVDCSCNVDVVVDGVEAIDYLFATGSRADRAAGESFGAGAVGSAGAGGR